MISFNKKAEYYDITHRYDDVEYSIEIPAEVDLTCQSIDEIENKKGQALTDFCEGNELIIKNGILPSGRSANFTFFGNQGESIIDFISCNISTFNAISDLRVMNYVS